MAVCKDSVTTQEILQEREKHWYFADKSKSNDFMLGSKIPLKNEPEQEELEVTSLK